MDVVIRAAAAHAGHRATQRHIATRTNALILAGNTSGSNGFVRRFIHFCVSSRGIPCCRWRLAKTCRCSNTALTWPSRSMDACSPLGNSTRQEQLDCCDPTTQAATTKDNWRPQMWPRGVRSLSFTEMLSRQGGVVSPPRVNKSMEEGWRRTCVVASRSMTHFSLAALVPLDSHTFKQPPSS